MNVSTAATAAKKVYCLAVFGDLGEKFAAVGVVDDGSAGNVDDDIVAVFAERASGASGLAVSGEDMAVIAQRQKRPEMAVATQYDVASATAVAAVGAPFRNIFGAVEMARSGASLAAAGEDFYVVYEVGVCHNSGLSRIGYEFVGRDMRSQAWR